MSDNTKGTDPYNTADPTIDTLEWEPQSNARQPVQIEYNDEYWRDVWGMKLEGEQNG